MSKLEDCKYSSKFRLKLGFDNRFARSGDNYVRRRNIYLLSANDNTFTIANGWPCNEQW